VIVDAGVKGVDGSGVHELIHSTKAANVPILMLLPATREQQMVRSCKKLGVDHFLFKPPGQLALLGEVEALLKGAPASAGTLHPEPPAEPVGPICNRASQAARILLAEDHPFNRKVALALLQRAGYDAEAVVDGPAALNAWQKNDYDLILMDVQMPGMDGLDVTRSIREIESSEGGHIPIIGVTAHAMKEDRDKCIGAGMDDYVPKPIERELLFATIDRLLSKDRLKEMS